MDTISWLLPIPALLLAPFLLGVINRTKSFFAGRQGPSVFQAYYDLYKLFLKGATYSSTTTWVFRAGPIVGLAVTLTALMLVPFGRVRAPLAFSGDLVLLAYMLGLMRFFTVSAALDTGSAFEAMGASREVQFSALAEPALFLALAAVAVETDQWSLSGMITGLSFGKLFVHPAVFAMVGVILLIVFLTENARVPVDDPNTHLELTMIHEVMVLDHSGPDFAYILYSVALKLWVLGALLVGIICPIHTGKIWMDLLCSLGLMVVLAIGVGVVECTMARLRMAKVPHLLACAIVLAVIALSLSIG